MSMVGWAIGDPTSDDFVRINKATGELTSSMDGRALTVIEAAEIAKTSELRIKALQAMTPVE